MLVLQLSNLVLVSSLERFDLLSQLSLTVINLISDGSDLGILELDLGSQLL